MEHTRTGALHKLQDTDLEVAKAADDVRGRKMLDHAGAEIGTVDALFIDDEARKVRFLRVSSGGFLGLGATKFLVPVDSVTDIDSDSVRIDRTRAQLVDAPTYAPELVSRREYYQKLYRHYGHVPYWHTGYVYPDFPDAPPVPPGTLR